MLMGRFHSRQQLEGVLFRKKDVHGYNIYYPAGALGAGYVVRTLEEKDRIVRGYVYRGDLFIVGLIIAALLNLFLKVPFVFTVLAVVLVSLIVFLLSARSYVRGLEKSSMTLTRHEANLETANCFDWQTLIVLEIFAFLFLVSQGSAWMKSGSWQVFSMAVLSGIVVVTFGYLICLKLNYRPPHRRMSGRSRK